VRFNGFKDNEKNLTKLYCLLLGLINQREVDRMNVKKTRFSLSFKLIPPYASDSAAFPALFLSFLSLFTSSSIYLFHLIM
jgi:hypothetical protein